MKTPRMRYVMQLYVSSLPSDNISAKYQDNQKIKHTNIYDWGKNQVLC